MPCVRAKAHELDSNPARTQLAARVDNGPLSRYCDAALVPIQRFECACSPTGSLQQPPVLPEAK